MVPVIVQVTAVPAAAATLGESHAPVPAVIPYVTGEVADGAAANWTPDTNNAAFAGVQTFATFRAVVPALPATLAA